MKSGFLILLAAPTLRASHCAALAVRTHSRLYVLIYPTSYLVNRFSSPVALAGQPLKHVGVAGLLVRADAKTAEKVDRTGRAQELPNPK